MFLRTEITEEKKVVGKKIITNLAANNIISLWQSFMPSVKHIQQRTSAEIISMQVYMPSLNLQTFTSSTLFEKWGACQVSVFADVPIALETFTIPAGLYAVFLHKGTASMASQSYEYIFGTWLPASGYVLDNRPHFEIFGDKYFRESALSEEEIWIPIVAI